MNRLSVIMTWTVLVLASNHLAAQEQVVAPAEEVKGKFAEINGIQMYYEIHGEGEPLLLLHGFNYSGSAWNEFIDAFAEQYKVIVPDLRGHGRSTNPTGKFTHKQSALDVYALLEELEVDKFCGTGISTGGMTLIHMATQQPERAESIVLIGATTYFPEQCREIMREVNVEQIPEGEWKRLKGTHKNGEEQIISLVNQFHNFKDSYDDMNFTPPLLSTIKAKTFIVHGDRDRFFPVSIPLQLYESVPNSYLWIIPNGGHVPIYGKNRDTFTEKALEFLSGEWGSQNQPR
jgi:pimeloyl-ACP methyl ester carboxylesterase